MLQFKESVALVARAAVAIERERFVDFLHFNIPEGMGPAGFEPARNQL